MCAFTVSQVADIQKMQLGKIVNKLLTAFMPLISSKSLQFLSQNGKHPISDVITVVFMYMHSVCIQLYTVKSFKKS